MTDPIELRLHNTLKSAALPGAPESLREYLHQLPSYKAAERRAWRPSLLLLAATLALLMLAALSVIFIGSFVYRPGPTPQPSTSPSPAATQSRATDSPAGLLGDFSGLEPVLEESAGSPGTPISTDGSMTFVNLGEVELARPFIAALRCWGPGSARLLVFMPLVAPIPSGNAVPSPEPNLTGNARCNGEIQTLPWLLHADSVAGEFRLEVPAGASWQVEVGAFLSDIGVRPDSFGSLDGRAGWTTLQDFEHPDLVIPGSGIGIAMQPPASAQRMAVTLWCAGIATAMVSTVNDQAANVSCPTPDHGERVEFDVEGEEFADVMVNPDDPIWVRLMIEVDRFEQPVYPTPPPIPPDLANVTYAEVRSVGPAAGYVARGRLGEPSSGFIEVPGAVTARAAGDIVIVGITDGDMDQRLELWTPDSVARVRVLVESAAPAMLGDFWIDEANEQLLFSSLAGPAGPLAIHRVGLDGTGRRPLLELSVDQLRGQPQFAVDGSALVIDTCDPGSGACTRTVVDAGSLELIEHDLEPMADGCALLGTTRGSAVLSCFRNDGTASVVIEGLDGSERREVTSSAGGGGLLLQTDDGLASLVQEFDPTGVSFWRALFLDDGRELTLFEGADIEASSVFPFDLRLPDNWVLLASGELTDFPGFQSFGRQVPRLMNVLTGEVIELVHLPHDEEP